MKEYSAGIAASVGSLPWYDFVRWGGRVYAVPAAIDWRSISEIEKIISAIGVISGENAKELKHRLSRFWKNHSL